MRRHQANVWQERQEQIEIIIVRHETCTSEQQYTFSLSIGFTSEAVKCHDESLPCAAVHVPIQMSWQLHAIRFRKRLIQQRWGDLRSKHPQATI